MSKAKISRHRKCQKKKQALKILYILELIERSVKSQQVNSKFNLKEGKTLVHLVNFTAPGSGFGFSYLSDR